MRTAGEILMKERIKRGLSLEEVSQETKIKVSFLQAIEEGDYEKLPANAYAKGFVRSYARFLGLDEKKVLAFFRREYAQVKSRTGVPPQPIEAQSLALTPGKVFAFFFSAAIIIFLAILFWQYKSFAGAPLLLVSAPTDKITIERPLAAVIGRTDQTAQVFVNGEEVKVKADGIFEETINLNEGLNTIRIVARNKVGRESVVERVVEVKSQ